MGAVVPASLLRRPRRRGRLVGVLPLLALVTTLALLAGCSRDVEVTPPQAPGAAGADRSGAGQRALDSLVRVLRSGSASAAEALAAPSSRTLLADVRANARALRLRDLGLRYVDDAGPLEESQRARFGTDAWRGTVSLTYRYGGVDTEPARTDTTVTFVPDGQGARIAGFGSDDVRTPLWLAGRLNVVRAGTTLLAVAGPTAGRYPGLVRRAVVQVRRTLPAWQGPLVVEVPRTREQLDAALESRDGEYDDIAAVTTTADGSLATGSPVRVFVNPQVFGGLKERGAQVVMSHEATHVATGATFVSMPTWLLEGFADFVALDGAGVPVGTAAAQILRRVRADGPPDGLPTAEDLDPTASGLGATYEEAWLACRFLAQEYGAARLVRFYDTVSAGTSAEQAFRQVLGTTQRDFVARWRSDVAALARVAR